jgi:hypothetical protein
MPTRRNLTVLSCIGPSLICTPTTLGCTSIALVGADHIFIHSFIHAFIHACIHSCMHSFSCLARAERAAVLLRDTEDGRGGPFSPSCPAIASLMDGRRSLPRSSLQHPAPPAASVGLRRMALLLTDYCCILSCYILSYNIIPLYLILS